VVFDGRENASVRFGRWHFSFFEEKGVFWGRNFSKMAVKDLYRVPVYFKRMTLEGVRCFGKKQRLMFLKPDGTISLWNIIIGENGVGKTTVLRSIVLKAMPSWMDNIGTLFGFDYFRRDLNHDALIEGEFENIFEDRLYQGFFTKSLLEKRAA
jgi:hypothetical protein